MTITDESPSSTLSLPPRWSRGDTVRTASLLGVIIAMHAVAFGMLFLLIAPAHYSIGTQTFGVGLGITAYTLGMRHAFDADHIAAIDNTTRKLMADGQRPVSVGFWFALGHSSMVMLMAAMVACGAQVVGTLMDDQSATHQWLGLIGTSVSGTFLYLIAALNLVALVGIRKVYKSMRAGEYDEKKLEKHLDERGFMNRILGRLTKSIRRPGQMFPIGALFGLGFDTASEVTLMAMAGSGAASGLPWYAIICLPLLFACGMSLFDTLDGTFMNFAYHWAFSNPVRKVYYNLTITGLSIAVAFIIGTIELVSVLHEKLDLTDPVTGWISDISLDNVGYVLVGLFVVVWACALAYWRFGNVEQRWAARVEKAGA
ncbi:HoxN/HupN/NixA family nickel/cobalt transporter [Streptomyces rubellomurinus]|uniref:Nickel/cobalt efflux system n=2 Tax=Streptomyces TaxID=1883 RepID=A0A0F2T633_STRR3|nr:HoxN/HupN/NixA family nickel/cobalt transporter [Streptomyces rubellomurinus]KJS52505.1 nickel transporter [Streptomyces rubellomurinus subsp. indigoferus]KJS58674.1 nickel transporter [Streptomyces rubellomurinus]